ncbi:hypothetical protein [Brevundimonas sp.]|uniref:hypothetical protein n=1 Tax=Brevundimonas sp. TaxID=1871086 RepID=UPI001A1FD3E2|nr:hypothetical protein [Brevundimonas sp.]MBJ7484638.1 hypothetical protein [Brevundimonas sp.]
MPLFSPEERAEKVLLAMGGEVDTRAASGRYVRSRDSRAGIRLWATTQQRYGQDLAGVQFYGRGRAEGERLAGLLERNGFVQRSPQAGQLTFAKPVGYTDDGGIDVASVAKVRDHIDLLISGASAPSAKPGSTSFRAFMLASPLADIDVPQAARAGAWREGAI